MAPIELSAVGQIFDSPVAELVWLGEWRFADTPLGYALFMTTLGKQIEECLDVLRSLPLWTSGRAADLQWFQFGKRHRVPTRKGGTKEVGDFALHLQCAWRVSGPRGIVVASRDRYEPKGDSSDNVNFEWDVAGENRCDERMAAFLAEHAPRMVVGVAGDEAGGFRLVLDRDFSLDVFPDDSLGDEHWRFFLSGNRATAYGSAWG